LVRHWKRAILVTSTLLLVAVLATTSAALAAKPNKTVPGLPVQLSLGDSWAFGFGADVPSQGGYVPRLHEALTERYNCSPARSKKPRRGCKHLQLVNLAVGGATTPTLIEGKLPQAISILESRNHDRNRRNDVELVTLHIGGNDVYGPIVAACAGGLPDVSPTCLQTIQSELAAFRVDLNTALSILREAAGPNTTVVIGTYDNSIQTCQLGAIPGASQLAAFVLEGGGPVPQGLHDIIRDVAADYRIQVADVYGDLGLQDWVGGRDCLHPDDSGYAKVAEAFLAALGL
jgi:lysophospholipase L1-like esterase